MEEKKENQFNIELPADGSEGIYSNLVLISHSTSEYILDFIRIMPGKPKGTVKSRIIMTPEHAKRLMLTLQDNIAKYEQMNGKINIHDKGPVAPMGFGGGEA